MFAFFISFAAEGAFIIDAMVIIAAVAWSLVGVNREAQFTMDTERDNV